MFENELNQFFKRHFSMLRVFLCVADLVLLYVAFYFAHTLRFGSLLPKSHHTVGSFLNAIYPLLEIYMSIAWIAIALFTRLYDLKRDQQKREEAQNVLRAIGILGAAFMLFIVARGGYNLYSRLFLIYFFMIAPTLMIVWRIVLHSTLKTIKTQNVKKRNIVIIGAGNSGARFYHTVSNNPAFGYHVLGFLDDNGVTSKVRPMILGKLMDLDRVHQHHMIDEVVIALPKATEESIADLVRQCEDKCIRVNVIPNDYAALEGKRRIEQVGEFSLVRMREAPLDLRHKQLFKRVFDVLFSIFILTVVFPPVFILSAILIKLTSRGPIFFRQLRTGEDGRSFTCYKFRTMRSAPQELADSMQARRNDPRLTSIGRFLRQTNLDELPQFWNVLMGDMSVVGPRPHMLKHTEDYRNVISQYMVRHFVKPGLTGWAQVNGFRGATETSNHMAKRIEHDLYYIENWSFLFDLSIIGKTVGTMVKGDKNAY